jgi:uncharacterized Zn finger protein/superfamily II DNA or RNA helicase
MRKTAYGTTTWGKWFVSVLEGYNAGARLERGRTYADTGKVLSLLIEGNKVIAKVEGQYKPSYKVEIIFPPLREKERVLEIMQDDPALLERIAAGELPETLRTKLRQEAIHLIPEKWSDMRRSCTCPDNGDPCKHLASLYYILAKEIDADPLKLFQLRGIDLSSLVKCFDSSLNQRLIPPFRVKADAHERIIPENPPDLPQILHCTELILSLLPPFPEYDSKEKIFFNAVLAEFYHRSAYFETKDRREEGEIRRKERIASRSRWTLLCADANPGASLSLIQESVDGEKTRYSLYDAFLQFRSFSSDTGANSYRFLFHLFKFLHTLTVNGAFVPAVLLAAKEKKEKRLRVIWKPFDAPAVVNAALDELARYEDRMLFLKKKKNFASGRSVVDLIASGFLCEWVKRNYFLSFPHKGGKIPRMNALFFAGKMLDVSPPALNALPLTIDRWLSILFIDFTQWKYRLTLVNASKDSDIAFKLTMDILIPGKNGLEKIPLKDAIQKTGSVSAISAPNALARYLPELGILSTAPDVVMNGERLAHFLDEAAPLLSKLGLEIAFPKELAREMSPRLVLSVSSKSSQKNAAPLLNYLSLHECLDWQWRIALGGEIVDEAEFAALLKEKRAVVRFKDRFIKIDPEELAELFKESREKPPDANDFLRASLNGEVFFSFDAEEAVKNLFMERRFPIPKTLNAGLRAYQERGFAWACSLLTMGFGAILADDMGLGKTIQAISVLLRFKEDGLLKEKTLIIAPSALLENWKQELRRFAPSLTVSFYYGTERTFNNADVFLTTYQTAARDAEKLTKISFALLIIDEAHLLKNAETRASQTAKRIRARYKLALSGTPVENHLEDMRSLFDFILPGYLGSAAEFKQRYRVPIELMRDKGKAEELRKITAPFLMRRLKIDKNVIADLPDKIVINEFAVLGKEQAALYESVVREMLEKIEKKGENERKTTNRAALILQLLTSLKQICDHPRVYDKESPAISQISGKARLLLTLLSAVAENQEKTLVFSQYVETLECLQTIIQNELGESAPIYHGGLSTKKRTSIIDNFQTDSATHILLVSLKAGGLGLNLTAATRVIHYDLWYNPAVENQATDRAFRIGQKKVVFAHRLIAKNTFEEKIDALLQRKLELASLTVASGESWLAEMSEAELKFLFS